LQHLHLLLQTAAAPQLQHPLQPPLLLLLPQLCQTQDWPQQPQLLLLL
jgi:hypothetical protein